jgi:hypothetical protein
VRFSGVGKLPCFPSYGQQFRRPATLWIFVLAGMRGGVEEKQRILERLILFLEHSLGAQPIRLRGAGELEVTNFCIGTKELTTDFELILTHSP